MGRRRSVLAGTFAGVLLALVPAPPAGAHGGATLTIRSDGHGSVWVTGTCPGRSRLAALSRSLGSPAEDGSDVLGNG